MALFGKDDPSALIERVSPEGAPTISGSGFAPATASLVDLPAAIRSCICCFVIVPKAVGYTALGAAGFASTGAAFELSFANEIEGIPSEVGAAKVGVRCTDFVSSSVDVLVAEDLDVVT